MVAGLHPRRDAAESSPVSRLVDTQPDRAHTRHPAAPDSRGHELDQVGARRASARKGCCRVRLHLSLLISFIVSSHLLSYFCFSSSVLFEDVRTALLL